MALALVTCGPAYEPIDAVRRITNHSSGELGTVLSGALDAAGFRVLCLRGEGAVFPPPAAAEVRPFSTNASLRAELERLAEAPAAIFHAAALCDFLVGAVEGADAARKIRGSTPEIRLTLRPAPKLLPELRRLFPKALIVGWKYELDGTRNDALARGAEQIAKARTDACVVNGAAYGSGFAILEPGRTEEIHLPGKPELCGFLAAWARDKLSPTRAAATIA